ncbi:hypothetical protein POTOM_055562 [Populus tomentosa]|uniref:Uncharacterized protein n=1 Tax=Populus tomentosa TaxID=118781 RepID=A0A8X7Y3L6_POPTO|nr:hypothetical protein POTOM_055562 [Populus tomentosa]
MRSVQLLQGSRPNTRCIVFQICGRDATGALPIADSSSPKTSRISYDEQRRTQIFLKDQIPTWFAVAGYVTIAAFSTTAVPHIFPELKWYYILVIYIFAPALAFCNAYGCGLTDWPLASTYGTLAIFVIGAWAGASHGGVPAGLAACGVMMNIVSTASDLSQDFKTGYLTLSSPRSMFKDSHLYPAPYATVFRNMAILGVEGFSSLPKNCLYLCYWFFGAAILINLIKDGLGKKRARFIPNPMAMDIDKAKADAFGPAVASGLICGDGIWTLPSSILALAGVAGMFILNILQLSLLISSSLFVSDLPESHPRPLLLSWVAALLPSIPQLLFCSLMLSQLLHQYVLSLDFTQSGSPILHVPSLGSYLHGALGEVSCDL